MVSRREPKTRDERVARLLGVPLKNVKKIKKQQRELFA